VLARGRGAYAPDGRPLRMTGVTLDVTDRKHAEQELERARDAAEAANRAKDHFLAVLSHELRTPLNPVLMAAGALLEDYELPPEARHDVEMIRRNVELEARLIDDLLDLTRIARGKVELRCEATDVHAVLRHTADTCRDADFHEKGITLDLELTAPHHHVWADAPRLSQVFWNLIKNAIKFTPSGGRIVVRTRNEEDGGSRRERARGEEHRSAIAQPLAAGQRARASSSSSSLIIEVTDTGIGIEPEILPHIFGAFEQGDLAITRKFGGLGLGLAITRALVENHGGTIEARSAGRGAGATFGVALAAVPDPERIKPAAAPNGDPSARRGLRILLVEDHESTAHVLARLLRRFDHQVENAANVRDALRATEAREFDLLISDIGLPDGSGLELMREIRARYGPDHLKGIALSGYGMEEDVKRSAEAGFAAHLVKPINLEKLNEVIQKI
jgi:signal transduction histidine kinase/CheY-like chemotaxis protein